MEIKERAQRRFSIGNQLMLAIFALSLIFTVIISSISLYRDFNDDLARLDVELEQVKPATFPVSLPVCGLKIENCYALRLKAQCAYLLWTI